jgi:hydrogenase-4 component F
MIFFLAYILIGGLVLAIMLTPLFWRSKTTSISAKGDFLSSLTIALGALYFLLTLYVIIFVKLPVYAFNQYLFMDPLAIYEVLITSVVFLLAAIYGRGYIKSLVEKEGMRAGSLELFYQSFSLLLIVIIFSFFSNNLALFWILLELTTILSAV